MKVSVRLGCTIPSIEYGNVRPEVEITDIDCDGDIEAQLERAIVVTGAAFSALDAKILDLVDEATRQVAASMSMGERVQRLEAAMRNVSKALKEAKEAGKL